MARMAAASSAALTAPARPMARVPTGMPAGICTIDKSEIHACQSLALHRNAKHRHAGEGGAHARQMGRTAGPCHTITAIPRARAVLEHSRQAGPACGGRTRSAPHAAPPEPPACRRCVFHGRPVGLAAHDDADPRRAGRAGTGIERAHQAMLSGNEPAFQPADFVLQQQLALFQPLQLQLVQRIAGDPGDDGCPDRGARYAVRAACEAGSRGLSAWHRP